MAIYTVMEPPVTNDDLGDAGRVAFVHDGFSWLALILPPLFLVLNGMWLVLAGWLAVATLLPFGAGLVIDGAGMPVAIVIAILFAFEANGLRMRTLARRGYRFAGVVAGPNLDECERRFFARWTLDRALARGEVPLRPARPARPAPGPGLDDRLQIDGTERGA
ncbi:DUF2628 domain-containing protein [Segnochrobactraceae bacterium EtOH-i3]